MSGLRLVVVLLFLGSVFGQGDRADLPLDSGSSEAQPSCSGSVTGAVFITILVLLVTAALLYYFCVHRARATGLRKCDPESAQGAAYDNPHFVADDTDDKDGSRSKHKTSPPVASRGTTTAAGPATKVATIATNTTATLERGKTAIERVITSMIGSGKIGQTIRTKDDQCMEPRQVCVPLQGHDFAGLGFKIHGSLREGIYVKELLQRGPANQSGQVAPGDRIMGLTVVTDHMVFEDALTILSYASPYPVLLHLEKGSSGISYSSTLPSKAKMSPSPAKSKPSPSPSKSKTISSSSNLVHPTLRGRSQSFEDLVKIGRIDINKVKLGELASPSLKAGLSPLNSKIDFLKMENMKLVQRNFETRHSERAIDVPGVEAKPKIPKESQPKNDQTVQVHQPMIPHLGIDMPDNVGVSSTIESPNTKKKVEKTDSKLKFGVRVLPELNVIKKPKRAGISEAQQGTVEIPISKPETAICIETEATVPTQSSSDHDLDMISPIESDTDSQGKFSDKPDSEKNIKGSPTKDKKQKPEEKLSFGMGSFSFVKESKDASSPPNPTKDDTLQSNEDISKSKFGLNFGVPELSIPGFGTSSKAKTTKQVDTESKHEIILMDGTIKTEVTHTTVEMPVIDISSSSTVESFQKRENSDDNLESSDHTTLKMRSADMTFPSLDFQKQFIMDDKTQLETELLEDNIKNMGFTVTSERPSLEVGTTATIDDGEQLFKNQPNMPIDIKTPDVKSVLLTTYDREFIDHQDHTMDMTRTVLLPSFGESSTDDVDVTLDLPNTQLELGGLVNSRDEIVDTMTRLSHAHPDNGIKMSDIDKQINSLQNEAFALAKDNLDIQPPAVEGAVGFRTTAMDPEYVPSDAVSVNIPKVNARTVFTETIRAVDDLEDTVLPDSQPKDEEFSEINATDATKKKKYGIMFDAPDVSSPNFRIGQRTSSESGQCENNQSDEVKSFNLRVKSPSIANNTISSSEVSFASAVTTGFSEAGQSDVTSTPSVLNVSDEKKMKVIGVNVMQPNFNIADVSLRSTEEVEEETSDEESYGAAAKPLHMSVSEFAFSDLAGRYDIDSSSNEGSSRTDTKWSTTETTVISDAMSPQFQSTPIKTVSTEQEEYDADHSFGSAFGFKGFRQHIDMPAIETSLISSENYETSNDTSSVSTKYTSVGEHQVAVSTEDMNLRDELLDISGVSEISNFTMQINPQPQDIEVQKEIKVVSSSAVNYSDGEDTDQNKKFKYQLKDGAEIKDKKKSRMTFGFKSFGRSSSDTEEDSTDKVSTNPMVEKEKQSKTKNAFGFRFRTKSRSSDSEDNSETRKVYGDPKGDSSSKLTHIEYETDSKTKSKSNFRIPLLTSKETKGSTKAESEEGEQSSTRINIIRRTSSLKTSSDSEGDFNDGQPRVVLDSRGIPEKPIEPKNKSSKMGFKGFKNLKGKIQTEINKMRQDSPSSEDETISEGVYVQGEKRKKLPKKKEQDKTMKVKEELVMGDAEDVKLMSLSASIAKDNRQKVFRPNEFSESGDSDTDDTFSNDNKRKKRSKGKRKEEHKVVTTGVMEVNLQEMTGSELVNETITSSTRTFEIDMPRIDGRDMSEAHIARTKLELDNAFGGHSNKIQYETQDPKTYVVVKEMKLKQPFVSHERLDIDEVIDKVTVERKIPRPLLLEERVSQIGATDTDGGSWGSDSDMERSTKRLEGSSYSGNSVNLRVQQKRTLTDSEELKRRATSLGDLSRLHEGAMMGSLLERAVSLDLKNAAGGHPGLHVRRLQLPDSSATSIDEVDELNNLPPVKISEPFGMKSSSRWGTLEEALQLDRVNGMTHMKIESVTSVPPNMTLNVNPTNPGVSISNIEISGGHGSSVTAFSSHDSSWEDRRDDDPPSLPTSPMPTGKTTITVLDTERRVSNPKDHRGSDSNIVIVGSDSSIFTNNMRNAGVQMSQFSTSQPNIISYSEHASFPRDDFIKTFQNVDKGQLSTDDNGKVTVTMVAAEDHNNFLGSSEPPKARTKHYSSPQEMLSFDSGISTPVVTVNSDWTHENGDSIDTSDHNLSDEYITPDSSPQKSMTQITLDGMSGYTVTEGPFSRTVIISNPDLQTISTNHSEESHATID